MIRVVHRQNVAAIRFMRDDGTMAKRVSTSLALLLA